MGKGGGQGSKKKIIKRQRTTISDPSCIGGEKRKQGAKFQKGVAQGHPGTASRGPAGAGGGKEKWCPANDEGGGKKKREGRSTTRGKRTGPNLGKGRGKISRVPQPFIAMLGEKLNLPKKSVKKIKQQNSKGHHHLCLQ